MFAEWDKLFKRETELMQKKGLSSDEQDEFAAINSRLLELLTSMEQSEAEIHEIYMSNREQSKE